MLNAARRWSVQEVLALPCDGNRYEVVHGELLVTPSPNPRHEVVRSRIVREMVHYLERVGVPETFFIQSDVFDRDDVYVQPDFIVVDPSFTKRSWRDLKRPRLVVEILSPSSRRGDRIVKRPAYQALGAATHWIVDPTRRVVEIWHPQDVKPEVADEVLRWHISAEAPVLAIPLRALFADLPE